MLSRQERQGSGRLLVRTVCRPRSRGPARAHPPAGRGRLGASRCRTWSAGARRSGSRSRPATTGSPPGRSGFARCSTPPTVDDRVRVRGSGPVAFGTFTFDASSDGSVLIVPRTVLGRDGRGRAWLTTCPRGDGPPPGEPPPLATPGCRPMGTPSPWEIFAGATAACPGRAGSEARGRGGRRDQGGRPAQGGARPRRVLPPPTELIDARVLLRRLADRYPAASRSPATA